MNNENRISNADDVLEQFSQIVVPPDVEQRLDARLEEFCENPQPSTNVSSTEVSRPLGLVGLTSQRGLIGASVSVCILLVIGWFSLSAITTSRAFGQVKHAVQEMKSVVIRYENKNHPDQNMKVFLLESGAFRQEFTSGLVRTFDPDEQRYLGLETTTQTAWYSTEKSESDPWYLIRKILEVEQSEVNRIGTRDWNGRKLRGFLKDTRSESVRVEIWVDEDTHLPVEVNESPSNPNDPLYSHRRFSMRFEFNREIAPSLLSMTPPEGYRLVDRGPNRPLPTFPRGIDMERLQLKPGIGIGDLTWDSTPAAAKDNFGTPGEVVYGYMIDDRKFQSAEKPADAAVDYFLMKYSSIGLTLKFREDSGLISVAAESGIPDAGIRGFPGKTKESVAIGSTSNEVEAAYGKPSRSRGPSDAPFSLMYDDRGIAFALAEGRVDGIYVMEKSSK